MTPPPQFPPRSTTETLSAAPNRSVPGAISSKTSKEIFSSTSVVSEKETRPLGIFVAKPKEDTTAFTTPEAVKETPKTYNDPFKAQGVPNKIAINLDNSLTVGNTGSAAPDRVAGLRLKSNDTRAVSNTPSDGESLVNEEAALRGVSSDESTLRHSSPVWETAQHSRSRIGLALISVSLLGFGLYGFWLYRQRKSKSKGATPKPVIEDATSATKVQRPRQP